MKKAVRILFLFFCFLFSFYSDAQNFKVEYEVRLNILQRKGFLHISTEAPFYYEESRLNNSNTELNKEEEEEENHYTYIIGLNKSKRWYQSYSVKNDTIYNIEYIGDKQVAYYDIGGSSKWIFTKEGKKISDYNCIKATTIFRGRKYTAWFTPEIPVNVGPWKFSGLPGLILQIYDEEMNFSWTVTKISQNEDREKVPDIKNKAKLSFREFVSLNDKDKKEEINKVLLRFSDKDAIITGGHSIRGRELKYEWEE